VGVPPFERRDQFRFWVAAPVLAHRAHALHTLRALVRATCLRRTKARLAGLLRLPRKAERVERVQLAPPERELYDFFKRRSYLLAAGTTAAGGAAPAPAVAAQRRKRRRAEGAGRPRALDGRPRSNGGIVVLISVLRMICDHGEALLPRAAAEAWRKHDAGVVGWDVLRTAAAAGGRRCYVCDGAEDALDEERRDGEVLSPSCGMHFVCDSCVAAMGSKDGALLLQTKECPKCRASGPSVSPSPSRADTAAEGPSSKVSALVRNVLATLKSCGDDAAPIKRYVVLWCRWCDYKKTHSDSVRG
jgi:SWI/SNF-related matrix-associated actin-dependent regulator of chromatin subfamily A3